MSPIRTPFRRVAVLGAGVMGAQIATHLANVGVESLLFELPAKEGDPNGLVVKAIEGLRRLEPAPAASADRLAAVIPANYAQHLPLLAGCDLVIEAIAERLDLKRDLYAKVAPHLSAEVIFASNTSGLSIRSLSEALPAELRSRFCGIHFFNPPRYMNLVELIPCAETDPAVLDRLETFLVSGVGKGVVRAKDTPNFVANRVGVFSMLAAMHHGARLSLGFDVIDALTGPALGRPKSATFRTADVVGLDTLSHVIGTMRDQLPDDPWHGVYAVPAVMAGLIANGALGQKTRAGFYRKVGREIEVLDPAGGGYRASAGAVDEETARLLKSRKPAELLAGLRGAASPQARFLWACYRDLFHYCAYHLESIADCARDVDLAIRWGFGWRTGPFETWQAAGWQDIARAISEEVAAGQTLAAVPLPAWATEPGRAGVHGPGGSYSARTRADAPRSSLAAYARQPFPETVAGEPRATGDTVFETDAVRLWHGGDDVAVLSFKSKMHTIGEDVLDGVLHSVERAERDFAALVLWQTEPPFSVGANLAQLAPALLAGQYDAIEKVVEKFQRASLALRYSLVPTVAAVQGMALGGGCEFQMHCTRAVVALESYIGLVEAGVGLIPAGGGCKEFALRAHEWSSGGELLPYVQRAFQTIAMATTGTSALHSRELGFLRPSDVVVPNAAEILHVARRQALALAQSAYRPPLPARQIRVAGRTGIGALEMVLVNMRGGGFISQHDFDVGLAIARALCGGEVEAGATVGEDWLLKLERRAFVDLLRTEKTQARIRHMLDTGKPLRN